MLRLCIFWLTIAKALATGKYLIILFFFIFSVYHVLNKIMVLFMVLAMARKNVQA